MTDIVDNANKNNDDALARQIEKQRHRKLEPVRIVDGKHLCIDCGDSISKARVVVAPNAPRCIHCQSAKEKREQHFA